MRCCCTLTLYPTGAGKLCLRVFRGVIKVLSITAPVIVWLFFFYLSLINNLMYRESTEGSLLVPTPVSFLSKTAGKIINTRCLFIVWLIPLLFFVFSCFVSQCLTVNTPLLSWTLPSCCCRTISSRRCFRFLIHCWRSAWEDRQPSVREEHTHTRTQ